MTNNYLVHYTVELASGQFDLVEWVWVWGWGLGKLRRDCINWDLQWIFVCRNTIQVKYWEKQKRFFNNLNPSVAPGPSPLKNTDMLRTFIYLLCTHNLRYLFNYKDSSRLLIDQLTSNTPKRCHYLLHNSKDILRTTHQI